MKGFQEKQKLVQIYKKLEQDWNTVKQNSNSKTMRSYNHHHHSSSDLTEEQGYGYYCNFPRKITCEIQQEEGNRSPPQEEEEKDCNIDSMKVWTDKDIEACEEIHERVEPIESDKLNCNMYYDHDFPEDVDSNEGYKKCGTNCYGPRGGCYCCYFPLPSSSSVSSGSSYNADVDYYDEKFVREVADMVVRVLEMRAATARVVERVENEKNKGRERKGRNNKSYGGDDVGEVVLVPT
ncbi:hypothetical protein PIB30_015812 [Stylosanthes scabra]|uniref:Uncharacterized protein n=1 Tax=Stylosanthes scabra TaxID=79078 RepID=A0ABU6Q728_9FABA|nr:hypothetical protein [Stylosanthes scabra]